MTEERPDDRAQFETELESRTKQLEQAKGALARVELAHQLLNDFVDNTPVLSFIKDEQGRYVFANKSFLKFFNVSSENLIGKTDFEWLPEKVARQFTANDEQVRETGEPVEVIETAGTESGTIRSIVHKFPVTSPTGAKHIGGVAVDIEARLKAEEMLASAARELAIARDQALEASNLKSAFLANISHELRTPLGGALGMLELLLATDLNADQRRLAETAEISAKSLLAILKDILDLSKIEAGKFVLEYIPFNLLFVVQECARLFSEEAKTKGLVLQAHIDQHIPQFVFGDPERIRQMLVNLISNGIKFTPAGSVIVRAEVEGEDPATVSIRFTVEDTGIGVAPQHKHLLFKPFSQVDTSATRKYGGTGLGLSISKHLVDMMGGRISVESVPGTGSKFEFVIPFKKVQQAEGGKAKEFVSSVSVFSGQNALIVEDNHVLRTLMMRQLSHLGLRPQVVNDGEEAIEAVKGFLFDVILMDCQLPGMDGFAATKAIRQFELNTGRHTPIIAVTAGAMEGDRQKCLDAGMDDYLSKPVDIQQLSEKIACWLGASSTLGYQ